MGAIPNPAKSKNKIPIKAKRENAWTKVENKVKKYTQRFYQIADGADIRKQIVR